MRSHRRWILTGPNDLERSAPQWPATVVCVSKSHSRDEVAFAATALTSGFPHHGMVPATCCEVPGSSLHREAMWEWLCSPAIQHPSGHCLSWVGTRQTGYPYPEVTGLLLTLLATRESGKSRAGVLAGALFADPQSAVGVGRASIGYTFDTAMAVRGLLLHPDVLSPDQFRTVARWCEFLLAQVASAAALVPGSCVKLPARWSNSFGAHQSKVAGALLAYREIFPERRRQVGAALEGLGRRTLLSQTGDGRFLESVTSTATYLHAHCYALEGLLMQRSAGSGDYSSQVDKGMEWLASVQDASGGIRAWHDGVRSMGPMRLDATAQAVRLFRLTNSIRYEANIRLGVRYLLDHQNELGGMPYEPSSPDLNTWATIFAFQAVTDDLLSGGETWAHLV
jgi:hypothetical protein